MTGPEVLDIARQAIWVMLEASAPMMIVALLVGLVIALFQALTQVQEMTLVFVPKILAVFLVLALAGGWMLQMSVSYAVATWETIGDPP